MNRTASIINTNNAIMSKSTGISSSSSISDIDKLMTSTATLATDSSSISSIDTTFLGAAAQHMCNWAAGISQEKIAAPDENDENDTRADDATGASAALPAEPVVAAMHENNAAYLRPRKRELHHFTLAVDILNEVDNEENDDEDTDGSISRPFDNVVERGLSELLRPRKKERHFFSIAEDILQELEGDE